MATVIVGIDEAGYGPTLGPLCVGCAAFRIENDDAGTDLWKILKTAVCREPGRGGATSKSGRIAIADSKELKLSNSVKTTKPTVHLERGVLTFLHAMDRAAHGAVTPSFITTDTMLFERLGADFGDHPCYGGACRPVPEAITEGEIRIGASKLAGAMQKNGVSLLRLACRAVPERAFNDVVRATGSKAETTAVAIVEHMRGAWDAWSDTAGGTRLGIVCDRLGGRMCYAPLLERAIPGAAIEIVEETDLRSRYIVTDGPRRAGVAFLTEGESGHMPIALASMAAKLTRELAMARFNRYWAGIGLERGVIELRPTAGYSQDAQRWMVDASALLTADDRAGLVRIA